MPRKEIVVYESGDMRVVTFDFEGNRFMLTKSKNVDGVDLYKCEDITGQYPVFVRTNEYNIYHYKIGDKLDDDEEWTCCVSKSQLIEDFVEGAYETDVDEGNGINRNWNNSARALLSYVWDE